MGRLGVHLAVMVRFDGDGAVAPALWRLSYFAHATPAQRRQDFIRAEHGAGGHFFSPAAQLTTTVAGPDAWF